MRTISLIPSRVHVAVGEVRDRPVAIVTLVGTGDFADIILEVGFDPSSLAALEAGISAARAELLATAMS